MYLSELFHVYINTSYKILFFEKFFLLKVSRINGYRSEFNKTSTIYMSSTKLFSTYSIISHNRNIIEVKPYVFSMKIQKLIEFQYTYHFNLRMKFYRYKICILQLNQTLINYRSNFWKYSYQSETISMIYGNKQKNIIHF